MVKFAGPVSPTPELSQARYSTLLRRLWSHVTPRRRLQLGLLVGLMLLSSLAELLTVASLVPFLAVLSNPESLWRQPGVRGMAMSMGIGAADQLILPIALLLMAAGLISAAIRATNLFVYARLSALIGSDLAVEAYRRTLEQPYAVHLGRNSSEVITQLGYLGLISRGVLAPLFQGLSGLIVVVVLMTGLLLYQPTLAALLGGVILISYGALARFNRMRLKRISSRADQCSKRSQKAQQEGLGAIRDVLLDNSQETFVEAFRTSERPLRLLQAEADTVAGLPRFLLEGIGIIAIAGLVLWLLPRGGIATALPTVGAIALGFQRLLPAVQQIYGALSYLTAYRDTLAGGLALLEQPTVAQPTGASGPERGQQQPEGPLTFARTLCFAQVSFCHQNGQEVIADVDFTVRPGEWIGLVGPTGSGKSTLLDLLMGLLSPSQGQILVDGCPLEDRTRSLDRRKAWQCHLSHVPQSIFLADASIACNIAFGVPPERIDRDRLVWAATAAQGDGFISELPLGFETPVGERGVRLSGGQRQRLGIARALYKQADVLVLDEATSALDNSTEKAVMDSLWRVGKMLTIFMVAHRITTLERCDRIIAIRSGRISFVSYADLAESAGAGSSSA
jgi:ABC-type multidrug transport system fused ATPase/permease subunit